MTLAVTIVDNEEYMKGYASPRDSLSFSLSPHADGSRNVLFVLLVADGLRSLH